jgi:hypothetical protein
LGKVIASVSELPSAVLAVLDDLTRYQKHVQEINNQAVFEVVASLAQIMPTQAPKPALRII